MKTPYCPLIFAGLANSNAKKDYVQLQIVYLYRKAVIGLELADGPRGFKLRSPEALRAVN